MPRSRAWTFSVPLFLFLFLAGPPAGAQTTGAITGFVLDRPTGSPAVGVVVRAYDATGFAVAEAASDLGGVYRLSGLAAGVYTLATEAGGRYVDEVYDDFSCGLGVPCDPLAGTPIHVAAGTVVEDVHFELEPIGCQPTRTSMCLNQGRFRVEVEWQTAHEAGDGRPERLTADAGYFWFFRPENVEVAVKVLDNCNGPTNRFWVFAAGLTDQETRLKVTDTVTGDSRTYRNPLGTPFRPILDTRAFATCDAEMMPPPPALPPFEGLSRAVPAKPSHPASASSIAGQVVSAPTGLAIAGVSIFLWHPIDFGLAATAVTGADGRYQIDGIDAGTYFVQTESGGRFADQLWDGIPCHPGCDPTAGDPLVVEDLVHLEGIDFTLEPLACQPSATTVCLNDGRFAVEATWATPRGGSGTATAAPLTADTGYLWFFRPENIEVVVKVLDNCNGPTGRFWVFAGGLTNLEVELEVTDTLTGAVKTYRNPQGRPFQPILDTAAFDTCP